MSHTTHSMEDDAGANPEIPQSQLTYIRCLTDTHQQYTRFFNALLILQKSHAAFLRDLKGFRSLPATIQVLASCNPSDDPILKEQRKENYRNVTSRFLASRFAHPWCRKAIAGTSNPKHTGWWSAEWAATGRKMSREGREEEEKLHKLLIPLWVSFRSKMFPGDDVVQAWWDEYRQNPPAKTEAIAVEASGTNLQSDDNHSVSHSRVGLDQTKNTSNRRVEPYSDDDDEHDGHANNDDELERIAYEEQASSAATGLLRLAAAGLLIDSLPKLQKWKLKRELKKRKY